MSSRWYNAAVVLLWLSSMTWLVATKLLPSWLRGEPPDSQKILSAQKLEPAVGWKILWNGRKLGTAVTKTLPLPFDLTQVRSLIHFDRLPIPDVAPSPVRKLFPDLDRIGTLVKIEIRTDLDFEPLGRLSRFDTAIGIPEEGSPNIVQSRPPMHMTGAIDGPKLSVWIRLGDSPPWEKPDIPVPRDAMLRDAFSPQSQLPGLHQGQTWAIETYNPMRLIATNDPKEVIHATVEGLTRVPWEDGQLEAWVVVFRGDPGSSLVAGGDVRGKLWVAKDGRVLKQEMPLFDSTMDFVRLPDKEAAAMAERAGITKPVNGGFSR